MPTPTPQWNSITGSDCVQNGVATLNCLPAALHNIITAAFLLAGIVAAIFIIIAGFKFLNSGGDPKQVEGARQTMTYAIIGLVLILLSFTILRAIGTITGVPCITKFGFSNCQ